MKLKRLLFIAVGLMAIALAHATSWRINPDPKAKAQFKTVEEAMDDENVRSGDMLLLDPGFYGNIEVTKDNIAIIGPGYLLDQNKGWSEIGEAVIENVEVKNVGCSIEGCSITSNVGLNASDVSLTAMNFSLKRCRVGNFDNAYARSSTNIVVEQCYFFSSEAINIYGNVILKNNIILGRIYMTGKGNIVEYNTFVNDRDERGVFELFASDDSSIIRNNIIINLIPNSYIFNSHDGYGATKITVTMYNNVTSSKAGDKDDVEGNINVGATVESTFINEGSPDGKWQLSPNSPAKGVAANGDDCGAFGGTNPYVLSGLPKLVPHITNIEVPARPTNGKLTIKLKIENQDE